MNTQSDPRTDRWLLPDGVNELLPEEAWRVEALRRLLMDNSHRWGYELVMPPLIEYIESLLTGTGETLDVQTFKFIDQQNGRTLGVRADMTPQVARIDAHAMRGSLPNRLFYTGSVLRARSDGFGGSRTPLQFGAELFGHAGPESDIEIIQLMIENVLLSGLSPESVMLDLGHIGVFKGLIADTQLPSVKQEQLFQAMLRGSAPEVASILDSSNTPETLAGPLMGLFDLRGECSEVLDRAQDLFSQSCESVVEAISIVHRVVNEISIAFPDLQIHIDLAEMRGYRYHTGIMFALYSQQGAELARGGRYDAIGESFGHARPATGFSGDLVSLALSSLGEDHPRSGSLDGIFVAPDIASMAWPEVQKLRNTGNRVVIGLAGSMMDATLCRCDRVLIRTDDHWQIHDVNSD